MKLEFLKQKWFVIFLIAFSVLIALSLLFFRIWMASDAVRLAYEVNSLMAEKKSLEAENNKAIIEIAKLKSPDRIIKVATTDLGMVRSTDVKVVFLKK